MPIASCGFPPSNEIPGSDPLELVTGRDLLRSIGPTTFVEVGYDPNLFYSDDQTVQQATSSRSGQNEQLVGALIDTGASESCIDEELAKALQLPLIDREDVSGMGGRSTFNMYLAHIRIPELGVIQNGPFMGVKLQGENQPHRALLGRTFLQDMILVYDGRDGSVRLAV